MRHILSKAYNDKSIACNVKYIGQSTAFNVTLMIETSPHTMQKALHLMQNAPHIMKKFFFRPYNIHEKITQF